MAEEEKKEIESSEEDEKELDSEKEQEQKSEEEESSKKDEFEKENEFVPSSKYNQALRKARELEARERDLKKQLEQKTVFKKEVEEESEGEKFFKDIDEDEDEETKAQPDTSKILDEKLKPVLDRLNQRDESDRKISRAAFFDAHPEYEKSAEKWQELLDVMDNDINPNSKDDHYTQLEKAHRILTGETYDAAIENKKVEIASDAASSGDGAIKGSVKEEFTAEDKKYMKEYDISEEGMRSFKKKIESGDMQILT